MLAEIKEILKEFRHVNVYDGYQVIAKIWEECLKEDTEIIASTKDFYQAARRTSAEYGYEGFRQKQTGRTRWLERLDCS
jgi:type I restriction enzyme M protein